MSSAHPPRGRPGRFSPLTDRANSHVATGHHGPVGSQRGDSLGDDFSDEPRLVFIGLGTIAMPFLFKPFHSSEIADG